MSARCCSHKVTLKPLANVDFHELHRCVLIANCTASTNTCLDVVSCGLGKMLAEPGRVVEGTLAGESY